MLTSIYDIDLSFESSYLIFLNKTQSNQLQAINLEKLTQIGLFFKPSKSILNFSSYSSFCAVGKEIYCLLFGSTAYLINLKNFECKSLTNSLNIPSICGCTCKNNIIYIFSSVPKYASYALNLNTQN